jgi:hypothetical protein
VPAVDERHRPTPLTMDDARLPPGPVLHTATRGETPPTAGVRAYLFSADAADYVRREQPAWQAWLQGLSVPA